MRLSRSSILIFTCLTCLGFDFLPASAATYEQQPLVFELGVTTNTAIKSILEPGSTGEEVKGLQTLLKQLGYYKGVVDGNYGSVTRLAVSQFQQAKGIAADGIVGSKTWNTLQAAVKQNQQKNPTPVTTSTPKPTAKPDVGLGFVWWLLVGIGTLGIVGALLYVIQKMGKVQKSHPPISHTVISQKDTSVISPIQQDTSNHQQESTLLPPETTSRLAKVNIVDELINDLRSSDLTQRRKAIWDLGQKGDSRAIQPLVDLMIDADSQQRSLILAALAEIGTRTLKPMNRALAISLQDESPNVRQNAIRDLTRIYDMMQQMSQMLSHAMQDPDAEVQATAKYALSKMNSIRALPEGETEDEETTPP